MVKKAMHLLLAAVLAVPVMVFAQEGSSGAATAAPAVGLSLKEVLDNGGYTMKALLAVSFVLVVLVFYYLFTLRASLVFPAAFIEQAEALAEKGDKDGLVALCNESSCQTADIVLVAAEQAMLNREASNADIRQMAEGVGGQHASQLMQKIHYLADIVAIAPMLGLLGTVIGMMEAFGNAKADIGGVQINTLANGVTKALVNTAGGLILALAATIVFVVFRVKVNGLIVGMERSSSRIINKLLAVKKMK
jgi:biopolymer transport protein ExbB